MAQIIWTQPALDDLQNIVDYIALDKPSAAAKLARKVFASTDRLEMFPDSDRLVPEDETLDCRQIVVPPCRIFYRYRKNDNAALILHVIRGEQQLDVDSLNDPDA